MIKNSEDTIKEKMLTRNFELIEIINYNTYADSKIKCRCKNCGTVMTSTMKTLMKKSYHKCIKKLNTKAPTTEEFSNFVSNTDSDYKVVGNYKNKRTKIQILHISKNHVFEISPEDFKSGCRCSICYRKNKKTTEQFKNDIDRVFGNNIYEVLGEYENSFKKIEVKHLKCGEKFYARPVDLLNHHGCPHCIESYYENLINRLLLELNIDFIRQKTFDGCKDKHKLRFDFYFPDLNTCLEYDGEQHFKNSYYKFGTDTLNINKIHDNIKNEFCKNNGIRLIRILYTDAKKITKEYLKQLLS